MEHPVFSYLTNPQGTRTFNSGSKLARDRADSVTIFDRRSRPRRRVPVKRDFGRFDPLPEAFLQSRRDDDAESEVGCYQGEKRDGSWWVGFP